MKAIKPHSLRAWLSASRPKTLTGAVVPVMIGTSIAVADGKFQWFPALVCLLFACLMQISANFINDLFDFRKGSDRSDRLGPERACAQGWISPQAMRNGIIITLTLACAVGSLLLTVAGAELLWVGLLCVLFAFLYTAGPYPLSYRGWGDVLVIVFFGFVPVGGTYYVQTLTWTPVVTVASLACGLVIDTLLVVNNYRDREADALSGKQTVVVRFGAGFGSALYLALGIVATLLCFFFFFAQGNKYAALLPSVYLVPHFFTWRKMVRIHTGKALNLILGETSRNMLLMGILLSVGLLLS